MLPALNGLLCHRHRHCHRRRWDAWARMTQPLFSRVPFVGTGGNHVSWEQHKHSRHCCIRASPDCWNHCKVILTIRRFQSIVCMPHSSAALQEIELLLTNDDATNTAVNARYPMPQASRHLWGTDCCTAVPALQCPALAAMCSCCWTLIYLP